MIVGALVGAMVMSAMTEPDCPPGAYALNAGHGYGWVCAIR